MAAQQDLQQRTLKGEQRWAIDWMLPIALREYYFANEVLKNKIITFKNLNVYISQLPQKQFILF